MSKTPRLTNSPPKTPKLSIVFSTRRVDPTFVAHLRASSGLADVEILPFENPGTHGLAELYNRGLGAAKADIIVFIHDDIAFDQHGWGRALLQEFKTTHFGILGIAGTTDLVLKDDGTVDAWWILGYRSVGRVTHEVNGKRSDDRFSNSFDRPLPVICLDGVLLAVDRRRLKATFDERFKGFHYYDIPFTFANHLAGVPVGVTFALRLTHRSTGRTDAVWEQARLLFSRLYADHLPFGITPMRVAYDAAPIKRFSAGPGLVSIIIPTRDRLELLLDCLRSLLARTRIARYEILIADTGSRPENLVRLAQALKTLPKPANLAGLRVIEYDYYNFARINNDVVQHHLAPDCRYLLFCNNDIKLLNDAVDRCLAQYQERTRIGTLGIRLHYADNSIQHNGFQGYFGGSQVVAFGRRYHKSYYRYDEGVTPVLGNTGAFLMIERALFETLRFNEAYEECYEDVELNLRLRLMGRTHYQVGHAVAYHYESQTRDENPDKLERQRADYERHLLPFFQSHCVSLFFTELFTGASNASRAGEFGTALAICELLLKQAPGNAAVHHLQGVVHGRAGAAAAAASAFQRAIALDGRNPDYHFNLGEAQRHQADWAAAEGSYRQALVLAPGMVEAHWRLAQVLAARDRTEEALAAYGEVTRLRPDHLSAYSEAAELLRLRGADDMAIACYRHGLQHTPAWAAGHHNLALILHGQKRYEEAASSLREALRLAPTQLPSWQALGGVCVAMGDVTGARDAYRRVVEGGAPHPLYELRLATLCPPVFANVGAIAAYREEVSQHLAAWRDLPLPSLDLDQAQSNLILPPLDWAYQGRDDLPLKAAWASICQGALPEEPLAASPAGKPHIGFLVNYGSEGVFAKAMAGLLNRLPAQRFQLTLACSTAGGEARLRRSLQQPSIRYLPLPENFAQSVTRLRAARFSLLYYWEVGTAGDNYFLPYFRLAPVQCTGWGWPVTSGIPAMDLYVSSTHLETAASDAHFSERLVRLPRLPVWIDQPPIPAAPLARRQLGLPEHQRLYLCVQNPRKVHPDFDALAAGVLRRDPGGLLVMMAGPQAAVTQALRERMQASLQDLAGRVRWLPRLAYADYLRLLAAADAVLDTPHFGGGLTTYDTLAAGVPLVTWPGEFSRGRYAYAAYRQMGLDDGIAATADDYVERALLMANAPEYRARLRQASTELFADQQAVDHFADFLEQAAAAGTT